MKKGGLFCLASFTSCGCPGVYRLPGEDMGPEYTMGRRQAGEGGVMFL